MNIDKAREQADDAAIDALCDAPDSYRPTFTFVDSDFLEAAADIILTDDLVTADKLRQACHDALYYMEQLAQGSNRAGLVKCQAECYSMYASQIGELIVTNMIVNKITSKMLKK